MNLVDSFPDATLEDLRLYFQNTLIYVRLPGTKEYQLNHASDFVSGRTLKQSHMALTSQHGVARRFALGQVDIRLWYPETGYLNWRSAAVRVCRLGQRQNQKGLSRKTVKVDTPFYQLLHAQTKEHPTFKLLDKYMTGVEGPAVDDGRFESFLLQLLTSETQTTPLDEAYVKVSNLSKKHLACAVSRKFALSKGVRSIEPDLWFDGILVGSMPNQREIAVTSGDSSIFYQEIADCFGPQGFDVVKT